MKTIINRYMPFPKIGAGLLKKLAKALRISTRELKLIEPEIYPDLAKDNTVLFYSLYFKKNASARILRKIAGIDFDNSVVLSINDVNGYNGLQDTASVFSNLKL